MTLSEIFKQITDQQLARGVDFAAMTSEQRQKYASECVLALTVEVGELASSWPFASWKTSPIDIKNLKREWWDCILFLVNIANCWGITPDELDEMFVWVIANNYKRIADGEHKEVDIGR